MVVVRVCPKMEGILFGRKRIDRFKLYPWAGLNWQICYYTHGIYIANRDYFPGQLIRLDGNDHFMLFYSFNSGMGLNGEKVVRLKRGI